MIGSALNSGEVDTPNAPGLRRFNGGVAMTRCVLAVAAGSCHAAGCRRAASTPPPLLHALRAAGGEPGARAEPPQGC